MDPIVPAENAGRLTAVLGQAGANVDHRVLPVGHGLSQADVNLSKQWLDKASAPAARG
jgi:phospholipase/carboxylesterase